VGGEVEATSKKETFDSDLMTKRENVQINLKLTKALIIIQFRWSCKKSKFCEFMKANEFIQ
jgi:hypothetical protein